MAALSVCIVDDDPMARMIAADTLAGLDYQVSECESGAQCLALFAPADPFDFDATPGAPPDVVLLDIDMPELNGFEVCRQLRAGGNESTHVIFVSGRDDMESRLQGFDAGGSDFIVKPYASQELLHHVGKSAAHVRERAAQQEQLSYAQRTAFSAMSSMGEMGAVLQFIRDSFSCLSAAQVADKALEACQSYGLNALLALRVGDVESHHALHRECTELEISILDYAAKLARIQQLGNRLVINYPNARLMVLDLPLDDAEKVDRLRDHLAIIAEGAEARTQSLRIERERAAQTEGILTAVGSLAATIADIESQQEQSRMKAHKVATDFNEKLLYMFLGMGLSPVHETRLAELAEDAMSEIAGELDQQAQMAERLRQASAALTQLLPRAD